MMKESEILKILQEIFDDIFEENSIKINQSTTSESIEQWDSLNHINLMSAIEIEFDFKFSLSEFMNANNLASIVEIIKYKIS